MYKTSSNQNKSDFIQYKCQFYEGKNKGCQNLIKKLIFPNYIEILDNNNPHLHIKLNDDKE